MFDHIANLKLAMVVLICVLILFFFPVVRGSFSAMHGPVSANRSRNFACLFFDSIRRARFWKVRQFRPAVRVSFRQQLDVLVALALLRRLPFDLRC